MNLIKNIFYESDYLNLCNSNFSFLTVHNFIFSDGLHYRILRHTVFWLLCVIFFEFTYFFPYYWFSGWQIHDPKALQQQAALGVSGFYMLALTNSILGVITIVFFTYVLIYLLLPRYLLKEKYAQFISSLLVLFFVSIVLFFLLFRYLNPLIRIAFGRPPKAWTFKENLSCSTDLVLFNCPSIGGVALGIKLLKRWWFKQRESEQLITAKSSAELQLLKAQVHPHFLFNTLNNIYSFTLNASPKAPEMIKKLSGLLRYIINECNEPLVSLEKELKMIQDYMALEKIRYGDQMDMKVDIVGDYSGEMIAPLLLIPFVENSFKHGTSKMLLKPWVNLKIVIEEEMFYLILKNSKPGKCININHNGGIGLSNVQKRLQLLYPGNHSIEITEEANCYKVLLKIDLQPLKEKMPAGRLSKKFLDQQSHITSYSD